METLEGDTVDNEEKTLVGAIRELKRAFTDLFKAIVEGLRLVEFVNWLSTMIKRILEKWKR